MAEEIVGGTASGAATGFMVGGPVGAVVGGVLGAIGGVFGSKARKKEEARRRKIAEYNSSVARMQGEAEISALKLVGDRILKRNREAYADDIMNVFARGGQPSTGTDYMAIIDNVTQRQLDVLENVRQQDIAAIETEARVEQIRMGSEAQISLGRTQAKAQMFQDIIGAGKTVGTSDRFKAYIG